jgi:hypothetical protein
MTKHEQANALAGAAGTIELGGHTFLVGQPTDADTRTIAMFVAKRLKDPLAALVNHPAWDRLSESQRDRLFDATLQKGADAAELTRESAFSILSSLEGCRFLAWLLIRKKHRDITLEQLGQWIVAENCEAVFIQLDEASGMMQLGNSDGRPGSPTTAD